MWIFIKNIRIVYLPLLGHPLYMCGFFYRPHGYIFQWPHLLQDRHPRGFGHRSRHLVLGLGLSGNQREYLDIMYKYVVDE